MSFLNAKTILVTGAGGSIGSELCRQILKEAPAVVVALDNSELALYNIDRELGGLGGITPVLGDITDVSDVNCLFLQHDFDVVYHAAAYKHVTLCEKNPGPAYRVNVRGTRLLVDAARFHGVPRFILISTDKAVRPTCVMGETKRLAEEFVRQANYTVVRLGNVWGSNGSVVPLWKEQIAHGKPVTITDPDAMRYFRQAHEVARSILDATELAVGGEVFVPWMGMPRKIGEVAKELGAKQFHVIGLRPGEKMHEELYNDGPSSTGHPLIWRDAA